MTTKSEHCRRRIPYVRPDTKQFEKPKQTKLKLLAQKILILWIHSKYSFEDIAKKFNIGSGAVAIMAKNCLSISDDLAYDICYEYKINRWKPEIKQDKITQIKKLFKSYDNDEIIDTEQKTVASSKSSAPSIIIKHEKNINNSEQAKITKINKPVEKPKLPPPPKIIKIPKIKQPKIKKVKPIKFDIKYYIFFHDIELSPTRVKRGIKLFFRLVIKNKNLYNKSKYNKLVIFNRFLQNLLPETTLRVEKLRRWIFTKTAPNTTFIEDYIYPALLEHDKTKGIN